MENQDNNDQTLDLTLQSQREKFLQMKTCNDAKAIYLLLYEVAAPHWGGPNWGWDIMYFPHAKDQNYKCCDVYQKSCYLFCEDCYKTVSKKVPDFNRELLEKHREEVRKNYIDSKKLGDTIEIRNTVTGNVFGGSSHGQNDKETLLGKEFDRITSKYT